MPETMTCLNCNTVIIIGFDKEISCKCPAGSECWVVSSSDASGVING